MKLTLEITVQSIEEYLQVLAVLDQAEENGELGFEWTARPASGSLSTMAAEALQIDCVYRTRHNQT